MELKDSLPVVAAIISPICLLIVGYLTFRVAREKNAFDNSKSVLETKYENLKIQCDKCDRDAQVMRGRIGELEMRVESLKVNESGLLKKLAITEERRDDYRDKYLELLERDKR